MTPAQFIERREALGLERRELADLLGVTTQAVGRYERGERRVSRMVEKALERIERDNNADEGAA